MIEQTDSPTAGLPLLYAAWLDEWLDGPIPAETEATCASCAMLPAANASLFGSDYYFNSKVKCCTYIPALPNFLVGRIVADERAEMGRDSTLARMQRSELVNPLWLEKASSSTAPAKNTLDEWMRWFAPTTSTNRGDYTERI